MKFKTVFISIITAITTIGNANAYVSIPYSEPDCVVGTCQDYPYSSSARGFLCGTETKLEDGCSCSTGGSFTYYQCACTADSDCPTGYCNNGACTACKTCSNCNGGTWENYGTGYQRRTEKSCGCKTGTCSTSYAYQCAAGYYGTTSNGTSGCTQCPQWTGVYTNSAKTTLARGTSNAGATTLVGCYITAGTYYEDSGTFKIVNSCSWTN